MSKRAFAIGNGKSRKDFDLLKLRPYGTSFGCNLLYQEFDDFKFPNYIVSIEDYRKETIKKDDFPGDRLIYPPNDEQFESPRYHGHTSPRPRSCCGINLIVEAARRNFDQIYFLGYDFIISDDVDCQSNQFEGSLKFRTNLEDTRRRIPYFKWMIRQYPYTDFTFVFPKETKLDKIIEPNLSYTDYEHFLREMALVELAKLGQEFDAA